MHPQQEQQQDMKHHLPQDDVQRLHIDAVYMRTQPGADPVSGPAELVMEAGPSWETTWLFITTSRFECDLHQLVIHKLHELKAPCAWADPDLPQQVRKAGGRVQSNAQADLAEQQDPAKVAVDRETWLNLLAIQRGELLRGLRQLHDLAARLETRVHFVKHADGTRIAKFIG